MAILESYPKYNMVTYLEKTAGNAEFHEVYYCQSSCKPVSISEASISRGKSQPLFCFLLVQPTEDGVHSERHLKLTTYTSLPHQSEAMLALVDQSPRPLLFTHIPDLFLESSGGNHGGQSSSDKFPFRNEGDMNTPIVCMIFVSLMYTRLQIKQGNITLGRHIFKKLKKKAKLYSEAEKKFKQLARDEEMARKVQEDWEAEEEVKKLAEEEAIKAALSNEYDFIQARIKVAQPF
ncbi:hypothetical protein Tco_0839477 [Tanacetum coccineum]|uniref:Uncharacterized protein n=1 Tax=Tanacetum coccineum TaxID=301880 RepID=A0ABQ5AQQ2_9ASTR